MSRPLMLLDTASLYFRAFFGVPDTRKSADAPPTNAASGLLDMIARLMREHSPASVVACWDDDWRPDFRVSLIPSYKEHRVAAEDDEEVPDDLQAQIPLIEAMLVAAGLAPVGAPGHEADDVIGTYATISQIPVDVVSGDRDLFQLVDDRKPVRVLYTARGISNLTYVDGAYVQSKYGIAPHQYADMASLRGDPSDGLPGVPGIGEKTAAALLNEHGDVPGVVRASEDPGSKMTARIRTNLLESRDYLQRAQRVVNVVRDLDLPALPAQRPQADTDLLDAIAEEFGLTRSVQRYLDALSDL